MSIRIAPRTSRRSSRTSSRARRPREVQSAAQRRRAAMDCKIVAAAEEVFAQHGFQGTSIADIAARLGISKQNLLYYFPSKETLYKRVLDGVLDEWLGRMSALADPGPAPETALRAYIAAKLRYSRERPAGSRVYANEIISGAPLYGAEIRRRVVPALRTEAETLNRWVAERRIDPIDPLHLMFVLWAMTQTYADFSRQMELVMGKGALGQGDFANAEEIITRLVLRALGLTRPASAAAPLAVHPAHG
jgi:TetR/AcrR family transcriptional regulator